MKRFLVHISYENYNNYYSFIALNPASHNSTNIDLMYIMKPFIKRNSLVWVSSILFVLFLFACSKHSDDQAPPVTPPVTNPDSMVISLKPWYRGPASDSGQYELIISTAEGSILLDTLLDRLKSSPISYKTTNKLVDLTIVEYISFLQKYDVTTYKSVNPSQWDTLRFGNGYEAIGFSSQTDATLHYYNVPANHGNVMQASSVFGNASYQFTGGQATLDLQYPQHTGVPVYLVFPTLALYKLYYPVTLADTVNLATMDTVISRNCTMNSTYTLDQLTLSGLLDTMNYAKTIMLYQGNGLNHNVPNVEYPAKYIEKYQMSLSATNADKDVIAHFSYGDTVAYNFNFPDQSNYKLLATQKDNFSVQFVNIQPTYYVSQWENNRVSFAIFSSKDSTILSPQKMIDHLKSRSHFLSGDFSDLTIKGFTFETVPNVDYPRYMANTFNSSLRKGRIIYWSDRLIKTF
jgi:hypothetical protein